MEIRQEIKRRAADIEARIAPFLPQEKGFQQTVLDAMEYSVFAGGKRLRPMLMEASYQMFDGTNPAIDDFMAAIEMIHTYSLIHDDLPAMDNDEYRRGKKTTHAVYGEAMAILAGDALLNYAFETVAAALTRNEAAAEGGSGAFQSRWNLWDDRRPGGGCGERENRTDH